MSMHQTHEDLPSARVAGPSNPERHALAATAIKCPVGHDINQLESHDRVINAEAGQDGALNTSSSISCAATSFLLLPTPLLPNKHHLAQSQGRRGHLLNEFSALQAVLSSPFAAAVQPNDATVVSSSDDSSEMRRNQGDFSRSTRGAQNRTNMVAEAISYIELLEAHQARLMNEKSVLEESIYKSKRLLFLAGDMQHG